MTGRRVAPVRPALLPAGLAGCLAGALALVALLVPRVGQSIWLRFSDPFGDHPPYSAVLLRVEPGDVRVLYGEGVEIRAHASGRRSTGLELVLEPAGGTPERVPMFPEGDRPLEGGRRRCHDAGPILRAVPTAPGPQQATRHRSDHGPEAERRPRPGHASRLHPPATLCGTVAAGWARRPVGRARRGLGDEQPAAGLGHAGRRGREHARARSSLVPTGEGAHEVYGAFEIRADGKLEIRVRDVAGQESREAISASVVHCC